MNLTVQCDYAFRTLMFLAAQDPKPSTVQEISEHYRISRGHLMVLVHRLGGLGFLENTRGRGGGIKLARPASQIRLGEIVQAIEPHFRLVECFNPESNNCLISDPCRLRDILEKALAAWLSVLNEHTLLDLVKENSGLVQLLSLAESPDLNLHRS